MHTPSSGLTSDSSSLVRSDQVGGTDVVHFSHDGSSLVEAGGRREVDALPHEIYRSLIAYEKFLRRIVEDSDELTNELSPPRMASGASKRHRPRLGDKRPRRDDAANESAFDTTSRAPVGKHFPADPTPSDHVRFLHGEGDTTFRYVSLRRMGEVVNMTSAPVRKAQKLSVPRLLTWVDELAGEDKVYLTQADFFWGRKGDPDAFRATSKYLSHISTVFVDLDVYASERFRDMPIGAVAQQVLKVCEENGVPRPLIICSGRGLYADWALTHRLDLRLLENREIWKAVQNKLMGLLSDFGADPKVSDLTRVLRLVGTHNSKSGTDVHVLHDDGLRYDIEFLLESTALLSSFVAPKELGSKSKAIPSVPCAQSGKASTPAPRILATAEAIAYLEGMQESDKALVPLMKPMRLRSYRMFADIASVVLARGGIAEGHRDEFVFWMLTTRYVSGLFAGQQLTAIAREFCGLAQNDFDIVSTGALSSLRGRIEKQEAERGVFQHREKSDRYGGFKTLPAFVKSTPRRVFRKHGQKSLICWMHVYTPSVAFLLDRLAITPQEQQSLSILKSKEEIRRRRSLKTKKPLRMKRNAEIIALRNQGISAVEISRHVNLHPSRVRAICRSTASAGKMCSDSAAPSAETAILSAYATEPNLSYRECETRTGISYSKIGRVIRRLRTEGRWPDAGACTHSADESIDVRLIAATDFAPVSVDCFTSVSNDGYTPAVDAAGRADRGETCRSSQERDSFRSFTHEELFLEKTLPWSPGAVSSYAYIHLEDTPSSDEQIKACSRLHPKDGKRSLSSLMVHGCRGVWSQGEAMDNDSNGENGDPWENRSYETLSASEDNPFYGVSSDPHLYASQDNSMVSQGEWEDWYTDVEGVSAAPKHEAGETHPPFERNVCCSGMQKGQDLASTFFLCKIAAH